MTNNFIFESSPNPKPKEKKVGVMAYYVLPAWKSGGTRPPCPPPNCLHDLSYLLWHSKLRVKKCTPSLFSQSVVGQFTSKW